MGAFFDSIPPNIIEWIVKQHVFYIASAPLTPDGHVNVSPKGLQGSFHVVNGNKVWYEDLTGSGVETISHLRENGRITVMFNAFEGPPRIVRLFGHGTVYEFGTPEYEALIPAETRKPGSRAAIVIDVYKVGSSCGYSVPFYDYKAPRTTLLSFFKKQEEKQTLHEYWEKKNTKSLDGLPGMKVALEGEAREVLPTSVGVNEAAGIEEGSEEEKVLTKSSGGDYRSKEGGDFMGLRSSEGAKLLVAFGAGFAAAAAYGRFARVF